MTRPSFIPELGQLVNYPNHQDYPCPSFVKAALYMIRDDLESMLGNIHQKSDIDPFRHFGDRFSCDTFEVQAFDWSQDEDNPQHWNFRWIQGDFEVSWYKHLGRSMSINKEIGPDTAARMLSSCLAAIERHGHGHDMTDADLLLTADDDSPRRGPGAVVDIIARCYDYNVDAAREGDDIALAFLVELARKAASHKQDLAEELIKTLCGRESES